MTLETQVDLEQAQTIFDVTDAIFTATSKTQKSGYDRKYRDDGTHEFIRNQAFSMERREWPGHLDLPSKGYPFTEYIVQYNGQEVFQAAQFPGLLRSNTIIQGKWIAEFADLYQAIVSATGKREMEQYQLRREKEKIKLSSLDELKTRWGFS